MHDNVLGGFSRYFCAMTTMVQTNPCRIAQALGFPVVPDVYMRLARSLGPTLGLWKSGFKGGSAAW